MVSGKTWQSKSDECRNCGVYMRTSDYAELKAVMEEYGVEVTPEPVSKV